MLNWSNAYGLYPCTILFFFFGWWLYYFCCKSQTCRYQGSRLLSLQRFFLLLFSGTRFLAQTSPVAPQVLFFCTASTRWLIRTNKKNLTLLVHNIKANKKKFTLVESFIFNAWIVFFGIFCFFGLSWHRTWECQMVLFHLDPGRSQKGSCDPPASLEYYFRALTLKSWANVFPLPTTL